MISTETANAAPDFTERGLLVNELKRVAGFAALSLNPSEIIEMLRPIVERDYCEKNESRYMMLKLDRGIRPRSAGRRMLWG